MKPRRLQRRRTKGWRTPPGAVYVGRPTRWGNPFRCWEDVVLALKGWPRPTGDERPILVQAFEAYARQRDVDDPTWLEPLGGHDLVCWCPEGQPCHADVLLRLANPGLSWDNANVADTEPPKEDACD